MSHHTIQVHPLPRDVNERALYDSTVIVVDLLRASTTICQALAAGAREVVPFLEIEEALAAAEAGDRSEIVLGGERMGGTIPGFDLGNSPCEYTPESVGGRRVFITTTNGTRALHHARLARRVLVGAFVNLSTVVASVETEARVDILCAGTNGRKTREDILIAGAIVDWLVHPSGKHWRLNGAATLARIEWESVSMKAQAAGRPISQQIASDLRDTPGGRNLLSIGLERDLVNCARVDCLNVVPEFDVRSGRIILAGAEKSPC
jgi:2-phosphosulfolactate phosphatase